MEQPEEPMDATELFDLYQELRGYVGWADADGEYLQGLKPLMEPAFVRIIDDFYDEIARHPNAVRVITGGDEQIARLKQTLRGWLADLFTGPYDAAFVMRRFAVGVKHVEIGLDQFYTNVSMSRIRGRLLEEIARASSLEKSEQDAAVRALNRIIDLDMAIIEFAYQREFAAREQQHERLATLGRVSAGIAHELRNPLNAVKTSVYYLLNASGAPVEKTQEHLERIDRQVGISDSVITALSRFAKLPFPKMLPVDLCELVDQTIEANPLPDNVELERNRPAETPCVAGDQEQLVIVLGNLIRNACDAMPDGGRLTLSGTERRTDSSPGRNRFDLLVTDTGCGIAPEDLPRIMEPLFSTKTRGLGLGLALAQAILERHDGDLSVNSVPGQGTTFTVTLNLAESQP